MSNFSDSDKSGYELLDHPADMGLMVSAPDLKRLFERAFLALSDILLDFGGDIGEMDEVDEMGEFESIEQESLQSKKVLSVLIALQAEDIEHLMYDWLSELLFQFDADGHVFKKVSVTELVHDPKEVRLSATAIGRHFDPALDQIKTYVKAITLHQLEIKRLNDSFQAIIYIDI